MRTLIALGLIAGMLAPMAAHAADQRFCREYAESAVEQARRAMDSHRCEREARGPRWSMEYRQHFEWCLGSRFEDARREREIRHEVLERCRERR
jgi:hypothetical protein